MKTTFSLEKLKEVYAKKGYTFFENGDYNLNIIGVRRKEDVFDNEFTDKLLVAYKIKGNWQLLEAPWTTRPGTYGGVLSPITVLGITGTAVLKEGQYRRAWQFIDNFTNWHQSPCFWQVLPVTVYRDGDRDLVFDRDMPQQTGLFGINLHAMGFVNQVNNWSIGCQGTMWQYFRGLVDLARVATRIYGDRFSYTLLNEKDFDEDALPSPDPKTGGKPKAKNA
jgi:hypothetical protein